MVCVDAILTKTSDPLWYVVVQIENASYAFGFKRWSAAKSFSADMPFQGIYTAGEVQSWVTTRL